MFFGTYSNTLKYLKGDVEPGTEPGFIPILLAGCIGGTAQLSVAVPVEVVKVVLQAQIPHNINAAKGRLCCSLNKAVLQFKDLAGWMTCDFTSFSTVCESYQDDGRVIMKGFVQWKPVCHWKESKLMTLVV